MWRVLNGEILMSNINIYTYVVSSRNKNLSYFVIVIYLLFILKNLFTCLSLVGTILKYKTVNISICLIVLYTCVCLWLMKKILKEIKKISISIYRRYLF